MELVLPALDEDGHHVVPVAGGQQGRIVGHLEEQLLALEGALHLDLALVLVERSWVLDVLTRDQELLDVAQAEVAGLVMLRHDDDGALLALEDGVDPHLLLLGLSGLVDPAVLQHLQQRLERLVGASQASGLGAGGPLKLVNEVDDLQLGRERIDLLLLGGVIDVLESRGGLISNFADVLGGELQLDLLVDALRLAALPREVALDLLAVGYGHNIHPDFRDPRHVVAHIVGELQVQPQRADGVLLLAEGRNPSGRLVDGHAHILLEDQLLVLLPDAQLAAGVGVGRAQEVERVRPVLVFRH